MKRINGMSARFLLWIIFCTVLMTAVIDGALYTGINLMVIKAGEIKALEDGSIFQTGLDAFLFLKPWFLKVFIPGTMAIALLFSIIFFFFLGWVAKTEMKNQQFPEKPSDTKKEVKKPETDANTDTRLFVHMLSVLQNEGRLLDFFAEKLDGFDDAQIGAAVRHIHDQCSRSLDKYLNLEPVMDMTEGDLVTIDAGFDPSAIKLTGDVTGNPPFKGILRHKGWKAGKLDIPKLSKQSSPDILAPAEVEIRP